MPAAAVFAMLLLAAPGQSIGHEQPDGEAPILMLPVDGPADAAAAMESELAAALRARLGPGSVVTHRELNVALTAERTKDVLGCDDVSCLNDILGALGGRFAIGVTLVAGQPLSNVTLILRDLEDAGRTFRLERRTPSLLPARLRGLADDLAKALCSSAGWQVTVTDDVATPQPDRSAATVGGTLRIASEPTGGVVLLNGERIGKAPMVLSGLSAGEYKLQIKSLGYHRHKTRLNLGGGGDTTVDATLRELRDWQAAVFFGVSPRNARLQGALQDGAIRTDRSLTFLEGGLFYGRELLGPIQVGGLVAYSALSDSTADLTSQQIKTQHGLIVGAHISVGGCLCMSSLASFAAVAADDAGVRDSAQAYLDDDEQSANFALIHARARAKLTYRTPNYVAAELGVEIGQLSIIHVEAFWAPIIFKPSTALEGDGYSIVDLDTSSFGIRLMLGFSAFYRGP